MPLYTFLLHLLNVLVQIGNEMRLQGGGEAEHDTYRYIEDMMTESWHTLFGENIIIENWVRL
jgi:hypothetical protein